MAELIQSATRELAGKVVLLNTPWRRLLEPLHPNSEQTVALIARINSVSALYLRHTDSKFPLLHTLQQPPARCVDFPTLMFTQQARETQKY